MKRITVLGAAAVLVLAGCKQPPSAGDAAVNGSTNIVVHEAKIYPAPVGATELGSGYYIVCKLTFTNTYGHDIAPEPKNFVLYDAYGQPYVGVDSGTSVMVGISNYSGIVKKDEKHDYTIGFRVQAVTSGAVFYAPY